MSAMTEKRDLNVSEKIQPQVNRYYLKVSKVYRAIGIALLLILLVFIVAVTIFYSDYVTYENVRYLAKDFGAMMSSDSDGFASIVYSVGDSGSMRFEYFKSGLAAANGEKYLYFDASGICLIDEDSGCSEPIIVPTDKYLLMYDLGSNCYSVYNQLTRIIRRNADSKIIAGDMSDSGAFILVTRSRETRYVVEVYNPSFKHTMSIYKENYVLDAAISPDGEHIIVCSAVPSDTDFCCEVSVCLTGVSENLATLTYDHMMPLELYAADDGFILLCDTGLYFYTYTGSLEATVNLKGTALRYADMNDESAVIVGSVNALGMENRIIVTTAKGEILLDSIIDTRVTGAKASQNLDAALAYLEIPDGIIQITPDGLQNKYTPENNNIISLVPLTNGVIICTKTGAYTAFEK